MFLFKATWCTRSPSWAIVVDVQLPSDSEALLQRRLTAWLGLTATAWQVWSGASKHLPPFLVFHTDPFWLFIETKKLRSLSWFLAKILSGIFSPLLSFYRQKQKKTFLMGSKFYAQNCFFHCSSCFFRVKRILRCILYFFQGDFKVLFQLKLFFLFFFQSLISLG